MGNWCKQCYYDRNRHSLADMQKLAESKGGKCLSTEYVSADFYLTWQCSVGHVWEAVPPTVRTSWCPTCSFDRKRLGIEKMRELAQQRGGKCLSETYKNVITKLTWQCHLGHVWEARPEHIRRGQWCKTCYRMRVAAMREESRARKKKRFAVPILV
jgi:hypothetical protein